MGATPGDERNRALLCTAMGKTGKPCRAFRAAGNTLCRFHSPESDGDREKAREAAREAHVGEAGRLRLDTAADVRQLIEETAQKLRAGQIHAGAAVALDRLARTALAAIDSQALEAANLEMAALTAAQPQGKRRR
jgi:hypothetical protein